jgi:hypothetical protein
MFDLQIDEKEKTKNKKLSSMNKSCGKNRFYWKTIFGTQPESSGWQSRNECM